MTVHYAGYDRTEGTPGYYPPRTRLSRAYRRALLMFRAGVDTLGIAEKLGVSEHHALKLVTIGRARAEGLPSPYEARR